MYVVKKTEQGSFGVFQADEDGNVLGEPVFIHEDESVANAHLDAFNFVAKSGKSAKAPYGDVTYADPGHQADKQKRYPIDTEDHIRAAWSYINMPKNASKYSSGDLAAVRGKIKSAAKKQGIEIEEEESKKALDFYRAALEWGDSTDFLKALFTGSSTFVAPADTSGGALVTSGSNKEKASWLECNGMDDVSAWADAQKVSLSEVD